LFIPTSLLDFCRQYQFHWAIGCNSPQLYEDSQSNLAPLINPRRSFTSLAFSGLSAQYVPSTILIRIKYFCLRRVSNHNDAPVFLGWWFDCLYQRITELLFSITDGPINCRNCDLEVSGPVDETALVSCSSTFSQAFNPSHLLSLRGLCWLLM